MSQNITYLVTGANRGIGRQIVAQLLLRPSTTVAATVRDTNHESAATLKLLPVASASKLVIVPLNSKDSKYSYDSLVHRLSHENVNALDIIIANAGTVANFKGILETDMDDAEQCFEVNTLGPLQLFQTCWPLLEKSDVNDAAKKKFVLITSASASIEILEWESFPNVAYGMSKAAVNWLVKKISVDFKGAGLKVGIIHPGLVATDMGRQLCDTVGLPEPSVAAEESARQTLEQVDKLAFDTTHGKFVAIGGKLLPW